MCDILESGGEVSKPSHLQIKYTANQDFGTNRDIIPNNKRKLNEIFVNKKEFADHIKPYFEQIKEFIESLKPHRK